MEKQDYFQAALANFTFDVASGGAIRHLADLGYTAAQIKKRLDFPTPFDRVQQAVWEHFLDNGTLRLEEPGKARRQENYEYITEYDAYGRKSFRRVTLSSTEDASIAWREQTFLGEADKNLAAYLDELCAKNGEETAYVACTFGRLKLQNPENYRKMLALLEENDQEYLCGLPWEPKTVYHRLNRRMRNIVAVLYRGGAFSGVCYFMETREKVFLQQGTV